METVKEISGAYHQHHFHVSIRTGIAATILIILGMIVLYPVLSFPPTFGSYGSDIFFHSIGLSMVALVVYLALLAFDLPRHEPIIDFPIADRALVTAGLAAASGIFFVTPALSTIPQIPTVLFVLAALFAFDITGAFFIELMLLPRKLGGTYSSSKLGGESMVKEYSMMIAHTRKDLATYLKMDGAYWLTLTGTAGLFIGEIIGLLLLWLMIFGTSFLGFYINSLGGLQSTLGSILDPHSHGVAVSLMAMVIGITVQRFGVLKQKGLKRSVASAGMWLSVVSLVLLTLVYVAGALVNYSPPTLFQNGPNGMAGDDLLITLVFVGGIIALIPLALTRFRSASSWRDGVRAALLFTLLMWVVANAVAGFYIEFNESSFRTTLQANDAAFAQFQPMFGIFFLTIIAMTLLAADYYGNDSGSRNRIGLVAALGIIVATLGGLAWVFINPSTSGYFFWAYMAGIAIMGISMLMAANAVLRARVQRVSITVR